MTTEQPDTDERASELSLAIAAVREIRMERARTEEERAKVNADYAVVVQTLQGVIPKNEEAEARF